MRSSYPFILTLAGLATIFFAFGTSDSHGQQEDVKLPGARRVVRAELYPSLQAAIDALPAAGGLTMRSRP